MSNNNACEKKREIINEIAEFGLSVSFTEGNERMKVIDEEFRGAGYAGEQNNDLFR